MPQTSLKTFHLPWNQGDSYWLCVMARQGVLTPEDVATLEKLGLKNASSALCYLLEAGAKWAEQWKKLKLSLLEHGLHEKLNVAVVPGPNMPSEQEIIFNCKPMQAIDGIADSLWIGEALQNGDIQCYFQPVIDKRGKSCGYESFARIVTSNGDTISGGKIFEASRALNIEHMLDRYLHVLAIKTFISSDRTGFLFVNFMPGFIHRPEVYLEGLTEAAKLYGMSAKNIVLECTNSEVNRDSVHLRRIYDFCRSCGYMIALDDIYSIAGAQKMIEISNPDFVKLDMTLIKRINNPESLKMIEELVNYCHKTGCTVIAEGVETEDTHKTLLGIGVDLFQGYLFSPPVAPGAPVKKAHG